MMLVSILVVAVVSTVAANPRYNQRVYVQSKAINFADPTKNGFRIVLNEDFLKNVLAPNLLPTLYVTAIPLRQDEATTTKMFYPDTIYEDKQVNIGDLKDRSWYMVCIEWENFSRHNETTGSECKMFRTLDRLGKSADSTVSDIAVPDTESQSVSFRLRTLAEFPMRLSVSLTGQAGPVPPSQVFVIREPSDIEGVFPFLRQDTNYGRLCVLEEPLVTGYTAMGRHISGLNINKCYFSDLTTKDYDISTFDAEASAYKHAASGNPLAVCASLLISFYLALF